MKKIESNNSVEIFNTVKDVVNFIENLPKDKYELSDNLDKFKGLEMVKMISELGICDRRRLKRRLNNVIGKKSVRSINNLLRFLSKIMNVKTVKITEPKHDEIQKLRKEWKALQAQADAVLLEYKTVKGDYYKTSVADKVAA